MGQGWEPPWMLSRCAEESQTADLRCKVCGRLKMRLARFDTDSQDQNFAVPFSTLQTFALAALAATADGRVENGGGSVLIRMGTCTFSAFVFDHLAIENGGTIVLSRCVQQRRMDGRFRLNVLVGRGTLTFRLTSETGRLFEIEPGVPAFREFVRRTRHV